MTNTITKLPLPQDALNQAFAQARTFNQFTQAPVSDELLKQTLALAQWGPTAFNMQPARFVFVKTPQAKALLKPALMPGNADKTMAAPVTVIVATDTQFFEHLPTQFLAMDVQAMFANNAAMSHEAGFRNGTLQGAYLMIAARLMGLDCGAMSGFDATAVNAAFFADGRFKANFLINLGYGDASGNYPRGPRLPFDAIASIA